MNCETVMRFQNSMYSTVQYMLKICIPFISTLLLLKRLIFHSTWITRKSFRLPKIWIGHIFCFLLFFSLKYVRNLLEYIISRIKRNESVIAVLETDQLCLSTSLRFLKFSKYWQRSYVMPYIYRIKACPRVSIFHDLNFRNGSTYRYLF